MTDTTMFGTCSCGVRWRQSGNSTGHCGTCHRTFANLTAFMAHQTMRRGKSVCHDPATLLTPRGGPRYRTFTDSEGATVWRSAIERPPGTWGRDTPKSNHRDANQPRTGARGAPEPPQDSDASQTGLERDSTWPRVVRLSEERASAQTATRRDPSAGHDGDAPR